MSPRAIDSVLVDKIVRRVDKIGIRATSREMEIARNTVRKYVRLKEVSHASNDSGRDVRDRGSVDECDRPG